MRDLIDFVQDDDRLREERKKSKKNKDKYIGLSSESTGFRSECTYRRLSAVCVRVWPAVIGISTSCSDLHLYH